MSPTQTQSFRCMFVSLVRVCATWVEYTDFSDLRSNVCLKIPITDGSLFALTYHMAHFSVWSKITIF